MSSIPPAGLCTSSSFTPGLRIERALLIRPEIVTEELVEMAQVQFLVDGLEVETLGGHIDLTRPLRTQDWL